MQYKMPGTNAQQKRLLAWNIIREVSLHSCKEEEVRQRLCVVCRGSCIVMQFTLLPISSQL
jgi:hypothetical protein